MNPYRDYYNTDDVLHVHVTIIKQRRIYKSLDLEQTVHVPFISGP